MEINGNLSAFKPVHCVAPVVIVNPRMQYYLNSGYSIYDKDYKAFVSVKELKTFIRPSYYEVFDYIDYKGLGISRRVFIEGFSKMELFQYGVDFLVKDSESRSFFDKIKRYYRRFYDFTFEYIYNRFIVLDSKNNIIDSAIMVTTCNRCPLCIGKKVNSISQRSLFQTDECERLPFFVTLTYNEQKYNEVSYIMPYDSQEFCLSPASAVDSLKEYKDGAILRRFVVDELQRFLKRLRIHLFRAGFDVKLKYYFTSEIGKHGRLHYHGLIWIVPPTPSVLIKQLYEVTPYFTYRGKKYVLYDFNHYIDLAWSCFDSKTGSYDSYGNVRTYVAKSNKVVQYINKYINKDSFNSPKYSIKSCLLGLDTFNKKIKQNLLDSPHKSTFCFTSHFDGKPTDIKLTSYFINKALPSFTMSLNKEYRDNLYDAFQIYSKYHDELYNKSLDNVSYASCVTSFENVLMPLITSMNWSKCTDMFFSEIYGLNIYECFYRFRILVTWLLSRDETSRIDEIIQCAELREIHFSNMNIEFDIVNDVNNFFINNNKYCDKSIDNQ